MRSKVKEKLTTWLDNRPRQSIEGEQLEWEANVVAYVGWLWDHIKIHPKAKNRRTPRISKRIPIYGPRFVPPGYHHEIRRNPAQPDIQPVTLYMKPLTTVHPFYYTDLKQCPDCDATVGVRWNSWVGTGARDLYGIRHGERAIGYQLRCEDCKEANRQHCFATTSITFWRRWDHHDIPRECRSLDAMFSHLHMILGGIPIFTMRSGATRELFDLIGEVRPSTTSGRLAEHIRRTSIPFAALT